MAHDDDWREKVDRAIGYLRLFGKHVPKDATFEEMCGDILVARDIDGRAIDVETKPSKGDL